MSWYVETLIIFSDSIRSNINSDHAGYGEIIVESNLDDNDFNNLLIVEKKIEDIYKKGLLASRELEIINAVATGQSLSKLESELDLNRITISKIFSAVCEKIAYTLGGEFTDDGYVSYMKHKHNLSDKQIITLKNLIKGAYRHRTRRYYE